MDPFENKVVLLTGGTGSFGTKFVEIILKEYNPSRVRILSRGELLQVEMERRFNDNRLRFYIGDVRDRDRVKRVMEGSDIVIHAAALKQIPHGEYNPFEVVKTNIIGSMNVVDSALDARIEKVLLISSDKAANPVTLYGSTKMVAERLFIQGNSFRSKENKIKLSAVRYGNVMASRGSVIPLFLKQKTEGKLTITDKEMTRFWLTQEQAIRFSIKCLERMEGGEIFIPKLQSMKVWDLAETIAPEVEKIIIGRRPGEKLHEILITSDESLHTIEEEDLFIVEPEFPFWKSNTQEYRKIPFIYASDTNSKWISREDMRDTLHDII